MAPVNLTPQVTTAVPEIYVYVISFFSCTVSILLIIVSFFLKNMIAEFRDMKNAWIKTGEKIIELTTDSRNQKSSCTKVHENIDKTLKEHTLKLESHSEDIAVLKRRRNG